MYRNRNIVEGMEKLLKFVVVIILALKCVRTQNLLHQHEELPVYSSNLPIVMYDNLNFEFRLTNRENFTGHINPTATFSNVTNGEESSVPRQLQNQKRRLSAVPLISSLQNLDQRVVRRLVKLMTDAKDGDLPPVAKQLIHKYVKEWKDLIGGRTSDEPHPEEVLLLDGVEVPFVSLPSEIEEMYKIVRMGMRTTSELDTIMSLLRDPLRKELYEEINSMKSESGKVISQSDLGDLFYGMLKLTEMYSPLPSDIFPPEVVDRIPLKDKISIALSETDPTALKESLKWIDLAQDHLDTELQRIQSAYSRILDQRRKSEPESNDGDPNESFTNFNFTQTYFSILKNKLSFEHDYLLHLQKESKQFSLFSESLGKASVKEQLKRFRATSDVRPPNSELSYQELCNGMDHSVPKRTKAQLECMYDNLNSYWLYLMPAKVEIISRVPIILFFHGVLTKTKIRQLQQLALPLQRESETGSIAQPSINSRIRASFVTFLDELSSVVEEVNLLAGYLTGLETIDDRATEMLQVNSYRPGGHYRPHMDTSGVNIYDQVEGSDNDLEKIQFEEFNDKFPDGDRMATLMFYLNEVREGGRTVFTKLGISVVPEEGGALLWYSLYNSGVIDSRLEHAGCPVKAGVKWVANKWINYNSQLFRRSCHAWKKYY